MVLGSEPVSYNHYEEIIERFVSHVLKIGFFCFDYSRAFSFINR
jgi:hypothetical protein